MAAHWTKDQQQVIEAQDCNLLVSAAAGSGKTAVLVERIIQKVTDPKSLADIDEMLVVTFTTAAAAEMRERIRDAFEAALERDPQNPHLLRQMTLVHNASIMTIHSFCMNVIRNHFEEIDLDPGFRIADEGEIRLLKADVMDALMERHYENDSKDSPFFALIDGYGRGGRDRAVTEMILELYEMAGSYPWPKDYLKKISQAYTTKTPEELNAAGWMQFVLSFVRQKMEDVYQTTQELKALCERPDGPACYLSGMIKDLELYERILAAKGYEGLSAVFGELKFSPIGNSRGFQGDMELLEYVKAQRDENKKAVMKLREEYFGSGAEEILADLAYLKPLTEELVCLTGEFAKEFSERKRKKNLLDYSDLEHMALNILVDENTHEIRPAAMEYQRHFREVMIDEYQDSNFIQEAILSSVSKESLGGYNRFMVGDVKQSIYRFRLACPQIFMEKYESYQQEEQEKERRIDLHMNFRSRREVLEFVNDLFYPLMQADIGNVVYDEQAALYPGAVCYEASLEDPQMFVPEILVGDVTEAGEETEERLAYEARMVSERILNMREHQMVTDKSTGKLRPIRFSDIVILLRSPGSGGEVFVDVLRENGIPAFMESQTGYFTAPEVETVLSLLKVLDNPYQDIPLAAVLHSPMFGFTSEELAKLRENQETDFAHCFFAWAKEQTAEGKACVKKAEKFLSFFDRIREKVKDTPIHELLEEILRETGYLDFVTAMPAGNSRRANLEKLIDQAVAYERSSYKGLFHFVRYIEHLQKYEVDFGAAEMLSENDDAVRLMSIHKSKGLEFPVVFVSGLGRQFNRQDSRGQMILHSEYGAGLEYADPKKRVKKTTLYKKAVSDAISMETLGEEMRVLYVALTRAKEKLVLTGVCKDSAKLDGWKKSRGTRLPFTVRLNASCFLEWVVRSISLLEGKYTLTLCRPFASVEEELERGSGRLKKREELLAQAEEADKGLVEEMEKALTYVYPFAEESAYKAKYSVSEMKHQAMEKAFSRETLEQPLFLQEEDDPCVPAFILKSSGEIERKETSAAGAARGTAVHRFLECFDFGREDILESLDEQIVQMLSNHRLTDEQAQLISRKKMRRFLANPIALRMAAADAKGKLYREKAFVMGDTPEQLFGGGKEKEIENDSKLLLIQGIIDVFFEEDDGVVLLDYKTDKVTEERELVLRYQKQLQLYAAAIERTGKRKVKEVYLYSFALDKTILLTL